MGKSNASQYANFGLLEVYVNWFLKNDNDSSSLLNQNLFRKT